MEDLHVLSFLLYIFLMPMIHQIDLNWCATSLSLFPCMFYPGISFGSLLPLPDGSRYRTGSPGVMKVCSPPWNLGMELLKSCGAHRQGQRTVDGSDSLYE